MKKIIFILFCLFLVACTSKPIETPNTPAIPEPVFCTMDAKLCPDGSAVGRIGPDCSFAPCPEPSTNTPENQEKTECKPSDRKADVCAEIYQPVCGWFNTQIQCIKYPCASTYSNGCFACIDDKVAYYTNAECPK